MPRLTFKETITMERIQTQPTKLEPFKKDSIDSIMADFASMDIYEEGFLKDLEKGLKESSVYRKG